MLFGALDGGELEVRRRRDGSRRLKGRFPYKKRAVLSSGGRTGKPKKEEFASRAFAYRVNDPSENIHLLYGHSYDKPLASKATGTLALQDSDEALTFDATIAPEVADTSHGADALALIESGLSVGLSPGFTIPPERAVPRDQAEKIAQEAVDPAKGMHGAIIRTILSALLWELSIVTRPAYEEATVTTDDLGNLVDKDGNIVDENGNIIVPADQRDNRNWQMSDSGIAVPVHPLRRWRL